MQIDSAADKLEQAYFQISEPGYLESYRIQVHAMKSLAATIGIVPLAGLAKVLEYAARDGDAERIHSMTAPFLEEWRSYQGKLQGVFGIGDEKKKEAADSSVIQALVEMLRISMLDMDFDRADELMEELQSYEYPDGIGDCIRQLKIAVENLDSDEVSRIADLLIGQMNG